MRSATRMASLGSRSSCVRTANSSPPGLARVLSPKADSGFSSWRGREIVSARRRHAVRRWAIWISRASPATWPRLSLNTLNSSMSMNNTANLKSACRRETARARPSRSRNRVRLARFGQTVVKSVVRQHLLGPLALGDVAVHHD